MSFLGKVLIFTQVVLSVLFMCAAGAVFTLHTNWREEATKARSEISRIQTEHTNQVEELNTRITALDAEVQAQKNRADAVVGDQQRLGREVAALTQQNNSLNQQLQVQTGLAETKSNEAEFRQAEAERQRAQNDVLRKSLDGQLARNVELEDALRNQEMLYEDLVVRHDALLEQKAFLEKVVRQNRLQTDPREVANVAEPPPPVEGYVKEVRKDATNRTKFVHITLGSDDGLQPGHELDVYRAGDRNNGRVMYLGRIRIMTTTQDEAVGLVVEAAKNGIIERGDNVTTKL
jgi:hypothetical protein